MSTDERDDTAPIEGERRRGRGSLATAIWTAADKGLPMLYGVAILLIPLNLGILDKAEFGRWTLFQSLFLAISLFGDYLLLQPMVKFAAEDKADSRPIITAGALLYLGSCIVLAASITLGAEFWSEVFKVGPAGYEILLLMVPSVLATFGRNFAIRVLQIDLQIVRIFVLDLVYFGGLIALMFIGWQQGTFETALDLVYYNLWALAASSLVGLLLSGRLAVPVATNVVAAGRQIIGIAHHQGWTGLMTVIQQNVDVIIVSGTRGSGAAGIYSAARIFYRVFEALREAAQLLLISATSNAWSRRDTDRVADLTVLATAALAALLYPTTVLLIALAPIGIPIVLPESDFAANAVVPFQWLLGAGFAMPFVIVPSAVLLGIGKTRDLLTGMVAGTVVMIGAGLLLTWLFGPEGMAMAVLAGNVTIAIILSTRMNRSIPFRFRAVMQRSRGLFADARRLFGSRDDRSEDRDTSVH